MSAILRCRACGTAQLPPDLVALSAGRYGEAEDAYYLAQGEERTRNAAALLAHLPPGTSGALLEIGCACGFLLCAARARGFTVTGIEPSQWAAQQARQHFGLDVYVGRVEAVQVPPESFDIVVMADTIEHLPSPRTGIAQAYEWLRPNGILLILTPNLHSLAARLAGRLWWALLDDHYVYFTPASLAQLLEQQHFTLEHTRSFGRRFTLGHWISKLAQYHSGLQWLADWGTRNRGLARLPLYVNLGDQMVCLARKR